ncbi:hypothetical protein LSUB1_G005170 [Lachnellula subtilissima]|uniref:Uncharacterized protein n=1 Tax=Lachnellula subtilissima TaxID=602034 RepID=A0A8H8RNI8_9HELO|nr:hypothetical protein LSUB1_G005170 [Lachnellula subtilissima]
MEALYRRSIRNGLNSNRSFLLRRSFGVPQCSRTVTTRTQPGKKPAKKPLKQRKELEYRPSSIKPPPPPHPHASPSRPIVTRNPLRYRTIPIVFGSITLFGLSAYLFYLGITLSRPSPTPIPSSAALQPDVSARYDDIAGSFDDKVEWTETLMGISKRRMQLVGMARGDVLEVSVGTGRNLEGYGFRFRIKRGVGKEK